MEIIPVKRVPTSEVPDIELLNRTAGMLPPAFLLGHVLEDVVRFVVSIAACDACVIYLLEKAELVPRASRGSFAEPGPLKVGREVSDSVLKHLDPVVIAEGAYTDDRFKLFNEFPGDRFEAFLSVPVVSGGRLIGLINLQNRAAHHYSDRQIQSITTIGSLIGAEIERARLESENSALLEKLETRMLVDRAKAILQRVMQLTEGEAYKTIRRQSQNKRTTMRKIAEAILRTDDPMGLLK